MAKQKIKSRKSKAGINPQYVLIIAVVAALAFVIYFASSGQTAKFYASGQSQKLGVASASYGDGVLTFNVVNDVGRELPTNKLGIRIKEVRGCLTEITTNPKKPIENAPKCVAGCGAPISAGSSAEIKVLLAGSKCDPASVPKGTIVNAQLFFGEGDGQVQAQGKFLV